MKPEASEASRVRLAEVRLKNLCGQVLPRDSRAFNSAASVGVGGLRLLWGG